MIHSCGVAIRSVIAGYLHLLTCPEAPPRQVPAQTPDPLMNQLIGVRHNPLHTRADDVVRHDTNLRRVE